MYYSKALGQAIRFFWDVRSKQSRKQKRSNIRDQGSRGAVTGGQQLNGLVALLTRVSLDAGVPKSCIFVRNNALPGFFRATKDWDFVIVSKSGKLIACVELKSQVGPSFGNNFNNRIEEALGSSVDLWTAFRKGVFPRQLAPWLGYLIVVEKCSKSTNVVKISEPYFTVNSEFKKTSYLARYEIFCRKLVREMHYTATTVIWTTKKGTKVTYGYPKDEISFDSFVDSFKSYLAGKKREFKS